MRRERRERRERERRERERRERDQATQDNTRHTTTQHDPAGHDKRCKISHYTTQDKSTQAGHDTKWRKQTLDMQKP